MAEAMNVTAASLPFGTSELRAAGFDRAPSSVGAAAIAESPASLECVEWGTLQIGGNRLIIGLVKRIHVRDELFDPATLRIRTDGIKWWAAWPARIGIAARRTASK